MVTDDTKRTLVGLLSDDWSFEGKRVLDFGCGAGGTLRQFLPEAEGGEFWGADVDAASIEQLQAELCPPFHALRCGEQPPLGLDHGSFDLIWALSAFRGLSDDSIPWLLELHRLLKPGAVLIATYSADEAWDEDLAEWWVRAHWGRPFEVLDIAPQVQDMSWALLRRREVELTIEDVEAPADDPREQVALRHKLWRLRRQLSGLDEQLRRERRQREFDLEAMRRSYEESLSWRLTRPLRAVRGATRPATREAETGSPAPDAGRDPEPARSVLYQHHRAGVEALEAAGDEIPGLPDPDFEALPEDVRVPEVAPSDATPELLRAAIMRRGFLIVRGAVGKDDVGGLVEGIDRAFSTREATLRGASGGDGYFEEFEPDPRFDVRPDRVALQGGRALMTGDSPFVLVDLLDVLERAGIRRLAGDYLGDRPLLSVNKSQLRKAVPQQFEGASGLSTWHQDGAFLGDTRALNVWISLSHCGDRAPGIDIVARRLEEIVAAGTSGSTFDWSVSRPVAEEVAGEAGIVRPIFEPGDALLFDEFLLHATAAEPGMTGTRYAVENWFFAASRFPQRYAPLAL